MCETLLYDEKVIEIVKRAKVTLMDPTHICALMLGDLVKVPVRIDVVPVAFYGGLVRLSSFHL